jgi:hypothetical protein
MLSSAALPALAADMPVKAVGSASRGPVPLAVGGWLFSPTLFAGAVYNSNVNQTNTNKVSSWGERVVPGLTANVDNGIYQTNIYGIADLQNYEQSGVSHQTTVDAKAGVTQIYMPMPDLTFRGNADFTRQADVFGSSAFAGANTTLSPTSGAPVAPVTVSPQINPDRYNQYSGSLGVDKRFGRVFTGLTGNVVSTKFDSDPNVLTSRDGTVYTLAGRLGFDITPQIYTFLDPSLDWQRYTDSSRNSDGYRISGGLGTAGNGIWQGEVYGGYAAEKNDIVGTYSTALYGVRIGYAPTRMWNVKASLDETLGASSIAVGGATGVATRVTTALVSVGYNGLPKGWDANARVGYVRTEFINLDRDDNGWLAGANVSYEVWRNLGVTLDYQFKSVDSNVAGNSFDQHMVSIGASYKY